MTRHITRLEDLQGVRLNPGDVILVVKRLEEKNRPKTWTQRPMNTIKTFVIVLILSSLSCRASLPPVPTVNPVVPFAWNDVAGTPATGYQGWTNAIGGATNTWGVLFTAPVVPGQTSYVFTNPPVTTPVWSFMVATNSQATSQWSQVISYTPPVIPPAATGYQTK